MSVELNSNNADISQDELDRIEWLQNNLDPDYSGWADEAWTQHGWSLKGWTLWSFWKTIQGAHNTGGFLAGLFGIDDLKYKHEYEAWLQEQEEMKRARRERQAQADQELNHIELQTPQATEASVSPTQ